MQANKRSSVLLYLLALLIFSDCQPVEQSTVENDQKLAQVFNKVLYLSDLDGMITKSDSPEDSLMILNAFVEKWVRDNLLMHEAERNIPKDLNIDKLVRDYRASLIRHSYEKRMVEGLLDSVVTQQELMNYYEANKSQYQLTSDIVRCHFIKLPKATADADIVKKYWESKSEDDYKALLEYASQHAEVYMLEDSTWYPVEDLALQLPKDGSIKISRLRIKDYKDSDDEYHYFLNVFEIIGKKKIAPLSYIKGQMSKVILHKRKLKLLDEKKEEFYERETQRNNVKVFVN